MHDVRSRRLIGEVALSDQPLDRSPIAHDDLGFEWELSPQFGAEISSRDWPADDERARRADVDDVEIFQLLDELRGSKRSVPANIHAPQQHDKRHNTSLLVGPRQPAALAVLAIGLTQPPRELAIEVSPIAESQVMHVQLPEMIHFAESRTLNDARENEVDVDEIGADAVHACEAHGRHEGDSRLRRCDIVRAAPRNECAEALEEIAADVTLALEELLD